jgi:bacillopeptidase F
MGADALWREGLDGTGVVVASIDTGVMEEHEQLAGRRLDGSRGWFDPVKGSTHAFDSHGHGTGVLSLAVGGNPSARVVGIAPGARWASALGLHGNLYSRVRMTLAADWVLRIARPDVLVNPWSHNEGSCNAFDLPFIDAWKAAGIFVVFPAGNAGPAPSSGESPASLGGTYPDLGPVFSTAGLLSSGEVVKASSRGPSVCGAARFPTLAAPGANLPYALASGPREYAIGDGTSFSAALVGGAAALLLQADPSLEPDELERLLVEGCRDLAPPGPDDATGSGAIDLVRSLERLRARRAAEGRPLADRFPR